MGHRWRQPNTDEVRRKIAYDVGGLTRAGLPEPAEGAGLSSARNTLNA